MSRACNFFNLSDLVYLKVTAQEKSNSHQTLRKTSTRAELTTLVYSTASFFSSASGLTFQNVISRRSSTKYKGKF